MWDDPRQLNLLALACALAAAALLVWGATAWAVRQPIFALHRVIVDGELSRASRAHLETVIREEFRGTFFTLSLARARASLERVPWVRSAALRRQWPDRLLITISEHEPLARWNDTGLVDVDGTVFAADYDGELPLFVGPEGHAAEMTARFREFGAVLRQRALSIAELRLSERGAWQLRTAGRAAFAIELGRNAPAERLSRFALYQPRTVGALDRSGVRVETVDLRYRNGFAARAPALADKPARPMG